VVEFSKCTGGNGSIHLQNVLKNDVTLNQCYFTESNYRSAGCVCATTGAPLLSLRFLDNCFSWCSVAQGTGVISSHHCYLYIEKSVFENCTIASEAVDSLGCFIFQKGENIVNCSVIGCTFDNENAFGGTASSIWIEAIQESKSVCTTSKSCLVFWESQWDSVFYWVCSSLSVYAPTVITRIQTASLKNIDRKFSSAAGAALAICDASTMRHSTRSDCIIRSVGNQKIGLKCGPSVSLITCRFL
jgi:hypothetical protein